MIRSALTVILTVCLAHAAFAQTDFGNTPLPKGSRQLETAPNALVNLVQNGGFEQNGGIGSSSFTGWATYVQTGSYGTWYAQTGTMTPVGGQTLAVPSPPEGTYAAMTAGAGPATRILYQDIAIPLQTSPATVSFRLYLNNQADAWDSPATLSYTGAANQQFRADLVDPAAAIDALGTAVLLNLYATASGDPLVSGYTTVSAAIPVSLTGRTVRLRFAEVNNLYFINTGIDNVELIAVSTPGCGSFDPATVSAKYSGSLSGCEEGGPVCGAGEAIEFSVPGYHCEGMTFGWTFGDGTGANTGSVVSHVYPATGTYGASVVVGDGVQTATIPINVVVGTPPQSPFTFTHLAGSRGGVGSEDGSGTDARFNVPFGIAADSAGNVYVGDLSNYTVRKVTPAGVVSTVAGRAGFSGITDGTGHAARFAGPRHLARDSAGNLYVADAENHTIRKITPAGVVTTFAGVAGTPGIANGPRMTAQFTQPRGVAIDSSGNIFVADSYNHVIRKIDTGGTVTTYAGLAGIAGTATGDRLDARFDLPYSLDFDSAGNMYVCDNGSRLIRKITAGGMVSNLAGAPYASGYIDATGSAARFARPTALATNSAGNIYVADSSNNSIRMVTPLGVVTTFAGSTSAFPGFIDGTGTAARFYYPEGVATDGADNVYVADALNYTIRKITPGGMVTTIAGMAQQYGNSEGASDVARFNQPTGIAVDASGNVFVADTGNYKIRQVTPAGNVTTFAGTGTAGSLNGPVATAQFRWPKWITFDGADLFVVDSAIHAIRQISGGLVSTYADTMSVTGGTSYPEGVTADGTGNLYVADPGDKVIRKIAPGAVVSTFSGLLGSEGTADGVAEARFTQPTGIAFNSNMLYLTDRHAVRTATTPGAVVSTRAGQVCCSGAVNGALATARFLGPKGVAIFSPGILVSEANCLRKVTFGDTGSVSTFAGAIASPGADDGPGPVARFETPAGIAVRLGNIYVADQANHAIRIGRPTLADTATISATTGVIGDTVQLDTSPQTATSWRWKLVRRPAGSAAALSSPSIRNPQFTPDVKDVYVFRLTASTATQTSITTATLDVNNTRPAIGTGPPGVTRTRGLTVSTPETIAGVADAEDSPGTLTVTVSSAPVGISITNIVNTAGIVDAVVNASASATIGPNTVVLRVQDSGGASSTANFQVNVIGLLAPASLTATATSPAAVSLTWPAVEGAISYEVWRNTNPSAPLTTTTATTYIDTTVAPNTTYIYKVRALNGGTPSAFSPLDVATTVMFTTEPLAAGGVISAVHLSQLRTAVNAMRAAAAMAAAPFTDDPLAAGTLVKAVHLTQLRAALDQARSAIGVPAIAYTDPSITTATKVKAVHVVQLRNGVK